VLWRAPTREIRVRNAVAHPPAAPERLCSPPSRTHTRSHSRTARCRQRSQSRWRAVPYTHVRWRPRAPVAGHAVKPSPAQHMRGCHCTDERREGRCARSVQHGSSSHPAAVFPMRSRFALTPRHDRRARATEALAHMTSPACYRMHPVKFASLPTSCRCVHILWCLSSLRPPSSSRSCGPAQRRALWLFRDQSGGAHSATARYRSPIRREPTPCDT